MQHGSSTMMTAAAFVVVVAGMQAAVSLLVPFLLAAFIAIICLPPLYWLHARGMSSAMAVLLIALTLVLVGALIGIFVGASVADFSHNLPTYQARLQLQTDALLNWLTGMGLHLDSQLLRDNFSPAQAMGMAGKLLAGLGNMLANTFLIILTVIFLLLEASAMPHKWRVMGEHAPSGEHFRRFVASVNSYLAIKGWVSLATGVMVAIWLSVLGVDYPLLWGLIAFLFNFVPNIGSIIAAVPAVLLALIQVGPGTALFAGAGYLVVNIVMGNVIEPRYMGRGVGLSTLVVFLSLVFWGWILGPIGMLLSVPLTMIVKLALETGEETRWIAVLLGPDVVADEKREGTT
ncbi:AI-2E family transporter [Mariprofundus erugo]|uniref:AI-2E family transporter n=1 Tax=Mariprofundus erugo TaxID=2528639 RepID=UPI0010FDB7EA|nr:AI-2E family transporter [Mariprofundus erugo]TLS77325.1 AI-2E family transporter [Mariprofundus erugo]